MDSHTPALSAIVVLGSVRKRAQRVVNGLCAQSVATDIEIIIVDLWAKETPSLATYGPARVTYLMYPRTSTWGQARAEGFRQACAPVVAFIEDHCFPTRNWAEVLIQTHQGPWAAVGYSFTNANPKTYISRVSMTLDYGPWASPTQSGPAQFLQNNNISYKRKLIASLPGPLEILLASDFNVQEQLTQRGHQLYLESRAVAAHHNFTLLSEMLEENFVHCRLVASHRADIQSWSRTRRISYALGTPLTSPTFRFVRLLWSLRTRRALWKPLFLSLPVMMVSYPWAGAGEALGYLLGNGTASLDINVCLLETERGKTSRSTSRGGEVDPR